jgi:hypothetical protein
MAIDINIPSQVKNYANLAGFPVTGTLKTIFIAEDTNKTYRWTGSAYVEISASAASASWGTITGTLSTQTDLQTALNAKQDTLVSGTNIKTINSTSLLGSGDIVISSGLTVGTTAIASGTIGRILFQNGSNLLGQDAALFWDNTNKRLGVGATPASTVRLDVRAQGALSTDIAFRVRNSTDTLDIIKVQGNNEVNVRANLSLGLYNAGSTRKLYMVRDAETFGIDIDWTGASTTAAKIVNNGTGSNIALTVNSFNGTSNFAISIANGDISMAGAAGTKIGTATTQKIAFWNKTPIVQPTTSIAAATFVTNTSLIANDTATFDGYTIGQVVKALRNTGILA